MAYTQIPNLPAAISLTGQEQLEAVQAGTSVRVTSSQIAGLAFGSLAEVTPGTVLGRFSDSVVGPAEELPISVDSSGNVGIGTSAPLAKFQVNPSAASGSYFNVFDYDTGSGGANRNAAFGVVNYNNDGFGDAASANYARGTVASPAIVQSGDTTAYYLGAGYDGATFVATAWITMEVDGTPGSGDMPGRLVFSTTADGAAFPTERMRITSAGNVSIGSSGNTGGKLEVYGSETTGVYDSAIKVYGSDFPYIQTQSFSSEYYGGGTGLLKARGTRSSPSIVQSGDELGYFYWQGWDGAAWQTLGSIYAKVDGTPGSSDMPGAMVFATTPDGSYFDVERMRITSAGNVGIGTSSPNASALLDVTSTTGGILFPRMTTTQRNAISSPANGLVVYNTTDSKLQVRAGGSWVDLH